MDRRRYLLVALALALVLPATASAQEYSDPPFHELASLVIQKADSIVVAVLRDVSCVSLQDTEHCIGALDIKTVLYPEHDRSDQLLLRWTFEHQRQSPVDLSLVEDREALWLLSAAAEPQTVTVFHRLSVYGMHQTEELERLILKGTLTPSDHPYLARVEALKTAARDMRNR